MALVNIQFCGSKGCRCPEIQEQKDGSILVGGKEEGFSTWTKEHLKDFVDAAKRGDFDELINKDATT